MTYDAVYADPNFPPSLAISASSAPAGHDGDDAGPSSTLSSTEHWQNDAIETYGIAGRIWEASYLLDEYLRPPTDEPAGLRRCRRRFDPPCPMFSSSAGERKAPVVLELGSGAAHVSLRLATRLPPMSLVVLSDLPEVIPLTQSRVHAARASSLDVGAEVVVAPLAWGPVDDTNDLTTNAHALLQVRGRPPTHLLLCDLVYFPFLYRPLFSTLLALTEPAGEKQTQAASPPVEVVIAYKIRELAKELPFWELLGTEFTLEPVVIEEEMDEAGEDEEMVRTVTRARFGADQGLGVLVARRKVVGQEEQGLGFEEILLLDVAQDIFD